MKIDWQAKKGLLNQESWFTFDQENKSNIFRQNSSNIRGIIVKRNKQMLVMFMREEVNVREDCSRPQYGLPSKSDSLEKSWLFTGKQQQQTPTCILAMNETMEFVLSDAVRLCRSKSSKQRTIPGPKVIWYHWTLQRVIMIAGAWFRLWWCGLDDGEGWTSEDTRAQTHTDSMDSEAGNPILILAFGVWSPE